MRAVIVDDSPRMRAELKQLLSRLGWQIVGEGENGMEALELVRTLRPDLMTLDVIMPEMDGIECYRHMRQMENPPRCLMITVLASEPRVLSAYEGEIYPEHFMKKPVTEKELKDKIEMIMRLPPLPIPPRPELPESAPAPAGSDLPPLPPLPTS